MAEERIYSVTTPDTKCCAESCIVNDCDRYFFTFPSCDVSDSKSVERCRTWVRNSGNIDLLKCKSSELAGKFYLCCHHFADWTAVSSTQRYIAVDAVPTIFPSSPLSNTVMKAFPVTSEPSHEPNAPESMDCIELQKEKNHGSLPDPDAPPALQCLETMKMETEDFDARNGCTSHSEDVVSEVEKSVDHTDASTPLKKKYKKRIHSSEIASSRPSRKAKQDAANRISKQFIPAKDCDHAEDAQTSPKESEGTASNPSEPPTVTNTESVHSPPRKIVLKSASKSPERSSAKYRIVSNDLISKVSAPRPSVLSSKISNDWKEVGHKITVLQESGSKLRHDKIHVRVAPPPPQSNAVFVMESGGLRSILPKPGTSLSPPIDKSRVSSFNLASFPRAENKSSPSSMRQDTVSHASSFDNVMPILRTTHTQTASSRAQIERPVNQILDSDSKLCVFTGLPSYDVLDNITDATLRMVLRNKSTINEIEPTMRLWIMMTCTKFMLGISTEAVSILYDIPEEEAGKVIEKTSLFLRKTLSLPDCQKYVWILPNKVLNGIADFSESVIS